MSVDTETLRGAIRDLLSTIDGLHPYRYWPGSLEYPAAFPLPDREAFGADFGGDNTMRLSIVVLAAAAQASDYERGQELLDQYLSKTGAKSIKAALDADPTLGGKVHDIRVVDSRDYLAAKWAPSMGGALYCEVMR